MNNELITLPGNMALATATDLADYLVRKGIPFRDAHEIVGSSVAYCVEHRCDLAELPLDTAAAAAAARARSSSRATRFSSALMKASRSAYSCSAVSRAGSHRARRRSSSALS